MLRNKSIILFLTIIMILISIKAWPQPSQKQTITQSKTKKLPQQKTVEQQKPTEQFVTPQQMIDAITRAVDASYEKYKATQNPPQPDNSNWWFSFFIVIFTGGLVVVGGFQCYIIFKTLKASMIAANAARDSVKIAETGLHISQQANLSVEVMHANIQNLRIGWRIPELMYTIINTGNTHGYVIEAISKIAIIDEIPDSPIYDKSLHNDGDIFLRAGGGITMLNSMGDVVTKDQYDSFKSGRINLIAWGRIIYHDIFNRYFIVGFGGRYNLNFNKFESIDKYNYFKEYEKKNEQS